MATIGINGVKPKGRDARTQWAAFAIRQQLANIQKSIPENILPTKDADTDAGVDLLYPIKETQYSKEEPDIKRFHVAIVGAGAAGLFTAMIFDQLNDQFGLDVQYDIIESRDR
jgi:hypothetical protein